MVSPRASGPIPLPVIGALIYVGVASLYALWLTHSLALLPDSLASYRTVLALHSHAGEDIQRAFGVVGSLLVAYLWVMSRSAVAGRRLRTLTHLGAALLVLLLQWGFASALRSLPSYVLHRVGQ